MYNICRWIHMTTKKIGKSLKIYIFKRLIYFIRNSTILSLSRLKNQGGILWYLKQPLERMQNDITRKVKTQLKGIFKEPIKSKETKKVRKKLMGPMEKL